MKYNLANNIFHKIERTTPTQTCRCAFSHENTKFWPFLFTGWRYTKYFQHFINKLQHIRKAH